MPNQPVNVTFWLDPKVKAEADALFSEMGLTLNTAVSMFVRQSIRDRGTGKRRRGGGDRSKSGCPEEGLTEALPPRSERK